MLTRDKNKRPSAQDLLQTDIFKKFKRAQTPGKSPFSKDYSKEVTDLQYLVAFSLDNVSQALATNPSLNSNKSLGKEEERKADDNLSSEMLKIKENLSETIISQNSSETLYPRTQSKEEFVTLARSILEEMPRDVKGESKPKMNETFARTNKTYGNTLELSLTGSKFLTISPEEKAALQSIGQKTMESTLTKKGENGSLGVKQKSSSARKYPSGPNREEDEEDYEYDDDFEEDYEEEEAEKDLNQFDSDSQLVRAKMTKGLLEDSGKPEKDYEFDEEDAYQSIEMEIALQSFQKSIGSPEKSMKKTMRLTSPHEEGDDIAEEIPEENDQFENSGKFVYDEEKMMEVAKLYKEQLDSAQNYPIMLNKYAVMEEIPEESYEGGTNASNNPSEARVFESSKATEIIEESIINHSKSYNFSSPSGKSGNSLSFSEKISGIKLKAIEIFGRERHQQILKILNEDMPLNQKVLS